MRRLFPAALAAIGVVMFFAPGPRVALAWPPSGCPAGQYGLIGAGGSNAGKPIPYVCTSKCHKGWHVEGGYCVKSVSAPPAPASQSSAGGGAAKCRGGPGAYKKQTHSNANASTGQYDSSSRPQKC
ncbi:MAG: hypothetical protein J0I79_33815 [Mesorhizobium sp.]|uniref:hypothetical protein n=1 Tax=Mesorhizobium sp. TaxID=1871066 RepID=UPI001ACD3C49|nr:hypothetical protein [Mesorhizobium sp.]MBN9222936.1 hypothetical protein [Mesorhizobium sp.]